MNKRKNTGFKDKLGRDIMEGDILVGLTDGFGGLRERDFVKWNYWAPNIDPQGGNIKFWNWNGHDLRSVAKNVQRIGNIFENPEMLLYKYGE